ncbi:MAG: hypothetical protein AAF394_04315 [Planctomycetota bacterium]
MKISLTLLAMILVSCFVSASPAETLELKMSYLTQVEPVEDAENPSVRIRIQVAVNVTMEKTKTVPVTKMRTEQRVRVVKRGDEEVEQPYTIQVPYTEQVTQSYTVQVPKKETRELKIPMTQLSAWRMDGTAVDTTELQKRLAQRSFCFLLAKPWPKGAKLSEMQSSVLRPDTLVLHIAPKKQQVPEPGEATETFPAPVPK